MTNQQQRVRRPDKEDARRRPVSSSPQVSTNAGGHQKPLGPLWEDPNMPEDIKGELLPELKSIVEGVEPQNCVRLLSVVAVWHPRLPNDLSAKYSGHRLRRGYLLPANDLAEIVWNIGTQPELIRLLSERGPDFGLSLLLILELCFQVAFCLRKPAHGVRSNNSESKRNYSAVVTNSPKLMEVLSLHLDCPPLRPRFVRKFALTCLGFLYHRKFPSACLTRFFQLHFFVNPSARKHVFEKRPTKLDHAHYLPKSAAEAVEEFLWEKAQRLSLGGPVRSGTPTNVKGKIAVESQRAAMAVVFERLNHVARGLFGTSLCLYGSAASGFATCHSDVDVVLQLGRSGVETMLEDLRRVRAEGGLDINPFPARKQTGFTRVCEDWSWTAERPPPIVATIWAGRKLAWACHRLYGWDVHCVQHAYVPIVRILAAVDETGRPQAVPPIFRPVASREATFRLALAEALRTESCKHLPTAPECCEALKTLCTLPDGRKNAVLPLLKTVAHNIICEKLYACWGPPPMDSQLTEAALCFYHALKEMEPEKIMTLPETQSLLDCLKAYAANCVDPFNDLTRGPGLPAGYPCELDDGRLTCEEPPNNSHDHRTLWLIDADCSMDRSVGIHNSRLLRAYASCDARVVAVTLLIKHWARCHGIGDAYSGYLSGYQWTLLVIHYLQHYLCATLPPKFSNDPGLKDLELSGRRPSNKKTMLPLLPNLQREPPIEGFTKTPVTVHELEGVADVFFYEPTLGANRTLPQNLQEACRSEPTPESSPPSSPRHSSLSKPWPEDSLLRSDPLGYAFQLLTCPFEMKATSVSHLSADELWKCRIASCPRPPKGSRPGKQAFNQWDKERADSKTQLLRNAQGGKNGRGSVQCSSYPSLDWLRDEVFINDHIMTRKSLQLPFHNALTLTELLYGFFEYYGMRFNFATDMSDIDRVPRLPSSKKEFFETSIFKPQLRGDRNFPVTAQEVSGGVADSARPSVAGVEPIGNDETNKNGDAASVEALEEKVEELTLDGETGAVQSDSAPDDSTTEQETQPHKEVTGRGKGAFQYRGRHFICIRDPFEKERTIGPPFYCQSHISTELLSALQIFGWARCKEEEEPGSAVTLIEQLFTPRAGHSYGHIYHPFKEALREAVSSIAEEGEHADQMYANISEIIRSHGNYGGLFDNRRQLGGPQNELPETAGRHGQQSQSQPPPANRRPSHGVDRPPPGFQEEDLRGPPGYSRVGGHATNTFPPSSAGRHPSAGAPSPPPRSSLYEPNGPPSSLPPSPNQPSCVEQLVHRCAHFQMNGGDEARLEAFPPHVRRFRSKDYQNPMEWLRSRSGILCGCPKGRVFPQQHRMGAEMEKYAGLAASCERNIGHPMHAWPAKAPPSTARNPAERQLLKIIQGKACDNGEQLDLDSQIMAHCFGSGVGGPYSAMAAPPQGRLSSSSRHSPIGNGRGGDPRRSRGSCGGGKGSTFSFMFGQSAAAVDETADGEADGGKVLMRRQMAPRPQQRQSGGHRDTDMIGDEFAGRKRTDYRGSGRRGGRGRGSAS